MSIAGCWVTTYFASMVVVCPKTCESNQLLLKSVASGEDKKNLLS